MSINYEKLMNTNPSHLGSCIDTDYYECPVGGDDNCVIAVSHENGCASYTNFYDIGDFYEGSEYNYVYDPESKEMVCLYKLEKRQWIS